MFTAKEKLEFLNKVLLHYLLKNFGTKVGVWETNFSGWEVMGLCLFPPLDIFLFLGILGLNYFRSFHWGGGAYGCIYPSDPLLSMPVNRKENYFQL